MQRCDGSVARLSPWIRWRRFAEAASEYCGTIDRGTVGLIDLHGTLARLIHQGCLLPYVDASESDYQAPPRVAEAKVRALYRRAIDPLPIDYYVDALDRFQDVGAAHPRLGLGSLADDLADTYEDLRGGFVLFDRGDIDGAVGDWRWGFRHHWGEHATSALRIIHERLAWAPAGEVGWT